MFLYLREIYLNLIEKDKEGVAQNCDFLRNKILSSHPSLLGEIVIFG